MGIDAMPPPASGLPVRLVLGPALRAQSDRRLVRLFRDGYEGAFDEIVRRYRRPLDRFAASIVGGHAEDVTQDSFRKALVALRHDDAEVELRPWLYRIVRNTALNDLRDCPPAAAELAEDLVGGGRSAAAVAEERAEVAALAARLRALPEKQRAALVMRELEGMSHEEIAAALGISGGAARQAIARGRAAVRSGFGALFPLPLLRVLAANGDGVTEAALGGAGAAAAVGAGGIGAGALKAGLATVLVAGSIGAGLAVDHHGGGNGGPGPSEAAASAPGGSRGDGVRSIPSPVLADVAHTGRSSGDIAADAGDDRSRHDGGGRPGQGEGGNHRPRHGGAEGDSARGGGHGASDQVGGGGPAPSTAGVDSGEGDSGLGRGADRSGAGRSNGGAGGRGGSGHGGSGHGDDSSGGHPSSSGRGDSAQNGASEGNGSGPHQGGSSQPSGSTSSGRGSGDAPAEVVVTAPASSTSGGAAPSSADDDSSSDVSTSGSSGGTSPSLESSSTSDDDRSGGGPDPSSGGPKSSVIFVLPPG